MIEKNIMIIIVVLLCYILPTIYILISNRKIIKNNGIIEIIGAFIPALNIIIFIALATIDISNLKIKIKRNGRIN